MGKEGITRLRCKHTVNPAAATGGASSSSGTLLGAGCVGEMNRVKDVRLHQLTDCLRQGFTGVRGRERQLLGWRGRRQQEHFGCLLVRVLPLR